MTHTQKIQIILHRLKIVLVDLIGVKKPICNDSKFKVLLPNHLLPIGISSKTFTLLHIQHCSLIFPVTNKSTKHLQPWHYVTCNGKIITKIRLPIFYRGYNFSTKKISVCISEYIMQIIYINENSISQIIDYCDIFIVLTIFREYKEVSYW